MWIRICQECLHKQQAHKPKDGIPTEAYLNAICRKCKSAALDFGREED